MHRNAERLWGAIGFAITNPNTSTLVVCSHYARASYEFKQASLFIEKGSVARTRMHQLSITLTNGSSIEFVPAPGAERLAGIRPDGVALLDVPMPTALIPNVCDARIL